MKLIPLTQGKFAMVDDEDHEFLSTWKWMAAQNKVGRFYARRASYESGKQKIIFMHRLINKTPQGNLTDHINGNSLDNRKANLRTCSNSENISNRGPTKNNAYGVKGIRFNQRTQKWDAQIGKDYKKYRSNGHTSADKAARAYDEMATLLHGNFAKLNYPKSKC